MVAGSVLGVQGVVPPSRDDDGGGARQGVTRRSGKATFPLAEPAGEEAELEIPAF